MPNFPTALDQGTKCLTYFRENATKYNLDPNKVIIAGDSVGGNMATVIARKQSKNILAQLLFYPVTSAEMNTESYTLFENGPWLTKKAMEWFYNNYTKNTDRATNPDISPLNAKIDDLRHLPPTLLITNEYDVLRDE